MTFPEISVVVCTWNRAESLRRTLEGMCRLHTSDMQWELVVVDNNSTDHTDRVVREFSSALPIDRVFEPAAGLSHARNAGVARARAPYVVWTDDDVTVDAGWLAAYRDGFRRFPDASFFGGRVVPEFEGGCRPHIRAAWGLVSGVYAERELGDVVRILPVDGDCWPFGANYAIRSDAQRRHRYDTRLGFSGGKLLGGEEISVMERIVADGGTGYWLPASVVHHRIEPFRQTTRYLRRYFRGDGLKRALLSGFPGEGMGCPRWFYRKWIAAETRYWVQRSFARPVHWMPCLIEAARLAGRIDHCRRPPGKG